MSGFQVIKMLEILLWQISEPVVFQSRLFVPYWRVGKQAKFSFSRTEVQS